MLLGTGDKCKGMNGVPTITSKIHFWKLWAPEDSPPLDSFRESGEPGHAKGLLETEGMGFVLGDQASLVPSHVSISLYVAGYLSPALDFSASGFSGQGKAVPGILP